MSNKKFLNNVELLKRETESLLGYLKARFPVFHNSNFFYRDLQYGIKSFLKIKEKDVSYDEAAKLTDAVSEDLEKRGIFVKVNKIGWKINYPQFATTEPGDPL
jgi:hypothetical protein